MNITKKDIDKLNAVVTVEINKEDYKDAMDTSTRGDKFSKNVLR